MSLGPSTFYFSPANKKELKIPKDKKSLRRQGYFEEIIYNTPESFAKFIKRSKNGDTLEIHSDGIPWVTGGVNYNEKLDLNPFSLAALINRSFADKAMTLTIDLRFCTSGVKASCPKDATSSTTLKEPIDDTEKERLESLAVDFCFAQDLSKALYDYGFRNMTVYGYTGYINAQRGFKESVCEVGEATIHGSKVKHCNLEDGRRVYQHDGKLVTEAKKILVDTFNYDLEEIKRDKTLRAYLESRERLHAPKIADMSSNEDDNELSFTELLDSAPVNFTPSYPAAKTSNNKENEENKQDAKIAVAKEAKPNNVNTRLV